MHPDTSNADVLKHRYGYGLTGRITYFLQESDPRLVLVAIAVMALLLFLALTGKRLQLFLGLLFTLVFYGSVWRSVDSATGVIRMLIIALLVLQLFRSYKGPGGPLLVFVGYVLVGLPWTLMTTDLAWSMQWGLLTLLSAGAAMVMADYMRSRKDVARVLVMFILATGAWAVLGAVSLRELVRAGSGGARFYGAFESIGSFTDSGGFCLAFVLWGAMRPWSWVYRIGCALLFVVVTIILLAAGQRTPIGVGIIASLPLLLRFNFRQLAMGFLLVVTVASTAWVAASFNRQQADYVVSRYTSLTTSNRSRLWAQGLTAVMENPIIGHGFGENRREMREHIEQFNTVHNMYLSVWYDTGIVGLALFMAAIALQIQRAFALSRRAADPQTVEMARLFFGNTVAIAVAGFFEAGASSPSALATTILLTGMVATHRLGVIEQEDAALRRQQLGWLRQQVAVRWAAYRGMGPAAAGFRGPVPAPIGRRR